MAQCGATTSRGGSCRNSKWSCPNHSMPQWLTLGGAAFVLLGVLSDVDDGTLVRGKARFPLAVIDGLAIVLTGGLTALMLLAVIALWSRSGRKLFFKTLLVVGGLTAVFLYGAGFF